MTTEEEHPEQNPPAEQPSDLAPHPASAEPSPEQSHGQTPDPEEEAGEAGSSDAAANGPAGDQKPEEELLELAQAAKSARLAPADEERAIQLLKETVPGGPKALPATLEAILTFSWGVGVKAVSEVWPETKPAGRTRLINGLAKADSDASRRIRLSLARGLYAQDPASSLKLITGVCEAMGGAQGGSTTRDRQIFANVMLGKARPWIMNVAMAEMKPADAQKLITPALESCAQSPIFTQIWVLRWICDAGKFDSLPPEHVEGIAKSISRWQARWKKELRKIIPQLPPALEAHVGEAPAPASAPAAPRPARTADSAEATAPADEGEDDDDDEEDEDDDDEDEEDDRAKAAAEEPEGAPEDPLQRLLNTPAPPRPPRQESQHQQARGGRDRDRDRGDRDRDRGVQFDLTRSLREIEGYVGRLRSELQQAQTAARRRDSGSERHERGRGGGGGRAQQPASPEELEDLRRHNLQLEEQNQELRHRIEELTSDHEDRAATLEINDALEQFKTFLGLKLKEDFADYNAISRESLNEVIRRHAHEILGRIFALLQAEGVRFDHEE